MLGVAVFHLIYHIDLAGRATSTPTRESLHNVFTKPGSAQFPFTAFTVLKTCRDIHKLPMNEGFFSLTQAHSMW